MSLHTGGIGHVQIINLEPHYHFDQKHEAPDDYQKHGVLGKCLICLPLSMALHLIMYASFRTSDKNL